MRRTVNNLKRVCEAFGSLAKDTRTLHPGHEFVVSGEAEWIGASHLLKHHALFCPLGDSYPSLEIARQENREISRFAIPIGRCGRDSFDITLGLL